MPTGIEEAGIVLAAVSVLFELFSGCVKGFQLLSTAHNLGKDCEMLMCWLKLEEYRLILWAKRSGLVDDNLDRRFDEELIKATLGELRTLLSDAEKLKKRYKLDVKDGDVPTATVKPIAPSAETLRFLNDETIQREQEKILKRAKFEQRKVVFPKRLWFAAVDRKGFEELIGHISTIVQRLFDLLAINVEEDTQRSLHLMELSLFSIVEKVEDLRVLTNSMHQVVIPDETMTTVASLRKLHIELADPSGSTAAGPAPVAKQRLLTNSLDQEARLGGTIALYEGAPVYVEWKHYSEKDSSGENAVKMFNRAQDLSCLLSLPKAPTFHCLRCIGYFNDPKSSGYCFIFDRPLYSQANVLPRSLLSLLKSSYMPSVTQRMQLALELATTLLHLHASGWLHKGLRAHNVLFFPATENAPRTLNEPFMMGYEYSRNDSRPELSEKPSTNPAHDIYRHPQAQGSLSDQYQKVFDVYSLGIIFVEIAHWAPIADVLEKRMRLALKDVTPIQMEHIRRRMIDEQGADKFPESLRFRMGDEFAKATLCCLGTVFEEPKLTRQDFISNFYDLTVRRLQNCKV